MPTTATLNANVYNECVFCSEIHDIETCSKIKQEKKNMFETIPISCKPKHKFSFRNTNLRRKRGKM